MAVRVTGAGRGGLRGFIGDRGGTDVQGYRRCVGR